MAECRTRITYKVPNKFSGNKPDFTKEYNQHGKSKAWLMKQYYNYDEWKNASPDHTERVWDRIFNKTKYTCEDHKEINEKFNQYLIESQINPLRNDYLWILVKKKPSRPRKKRASIDQTIQEVIKEYPPDKEQTESCSKYNRTIVLDNGAKVYVPIEHVEKVTGCLSDCGILLGKHQGEDNIMVNIAKDVVETKSANKEIKTNTTDIKKGLEDQKRTINTLDQKVTQVQNDNIQKVNSLKRCIENMIRDLESKKQNIKREAMELSTNNPNYKNTPHYKQFSISMSVIQPVLADLKMCLQNMDITPSNFNTIKNVVGKLKTQTNEADQKLQSISTESNKIDQITKNAVNSLTSATQTTTQTTAPIPVAPITSSTSITASTPVVPTPSPPSSPPSTSGIMQTLTKQVEEQPPAKQLRISKKKAREQGKRRAKELSDTWRKNWIKERNEKKQKAKEDIISNTTRSTTDNWIRP